ncbi:DNAH1 [Bugula neritina]|uniref:DNAH1 n=1 Tax=Bugula neritina TaxID=10212 RepID=A0A7J7JS40_BUGNE|nr:DNAH1 [Bugula neritina]
MSGTGRPFSANRTRCGRDPPSRGGQKYPEIKQRGYYSDILSAQAEERIGDPLQGPEQTQQDTLWQIVHNDHTPQATTFDTTKVDFTQQLKVDKHGKTTKSTDISDFPLQAYEPKVQLPFYTEPGQCPRKIEIERRKRHYQSQNLEALLAERGISTESLMPKDEDEEPTVILNADPENPAPFATFLDLETFDNSEYDTRTPEEWLAIGQDGDVRKPIPAKALLPAKNPIYAKFDIRDPGIKWVWYNVGVLDYDLDTNLYYVQKVNNKHRIIDEEGKPVVNGNVVDGESVHYKVAIVTVTVVPFLFRSRNGSCRFMLLVMISSTGTFMDAIIIRCNNRCNKMAYVATPLY